MTREERNEARRVSKRAEWWAASKRWDQWAWGIWLGYACGVNAWSWTPWFALSVMACAVVARHVKHRRETREDEARLASDLELLQGGGP